MATAIFPAGGSRNSSRRIFRPDPPVFRWLCLSLVLGFWPAWSYGADFQDLPSNEREPWVHEQITRLNADTLRERSGAERALLSAGPEVLPLLPAPELLPNVAVRQAVRRIRLRLEEAKARDSVKASVVTLKGTFPLKTLLEKITEQTGNPIDARPLPAEFLDRSIRLDASKVSFWNLIGILEEQAGFDLDTPKTPGESPALQLKPANAESDLAGVANEGAFRVEVAPLKLRPRFGMEDQQLLRVPIRLMTEPRLRPLFLKLAGEDFTARTKDDQKLDPFNPAAKLELPLGEDGTETSFHMDFEVPKPFPEASIQLAGKATLTVAAGSEAIRFNDLTKDAGAARRKGGVTVTLNEIEFQPEKKNPDRKTARFRITVHYDTGGPAFESHRTWMFHNRVYLEDAQGRQVERGGGFDTALQTDGGVIVEYNFENLAGNPKDYKFVYVAPTLIINVPLAFDFKTLPVPEKN